MFPWQRTRTAQVAVVGLLVSALVGCASQRTGSKGKDAAREHNWDAAVYYYLEALAREPDNVEFRMALTRARQKAAQEHLARGMALREMKRLAAARDELRMTVQLDPSNQFAEQVLDAVEKDLAILSQPGGEATLAELKRKAAEAKVQPPILDPRSDEPITLSFPKAKAVKEIYQAMAKAYGFNVLFDPNLKDDKLTLELNDVTAERALEIVMQAAGHFYKVLDEHSIIVVEDNPQNRREYEDLVIKTFFLSNADVKEVDKLLRSLIEARRLATNEQLNAITLRDTADKVAIAEKLIMISDKAKAEVLVDVELIEVTTSTDRSVGTNIASYITGLGFDASVVTGDAEGADNQVPLPLVENIFSRQAWIFPVPDLVINLVKATGEAEALAQPQLRITEGEKASLVIGDRVPIPVTSFNSANIAGGGVVPITSFQYQDVGIKIDVEPRVHHNREVTLKLSVEVSQLGDEVAVGPSQSAITIGTRTINSVIRLEDGETSLLAGLLKVDKTKSESTVPFLGEIPLLGKLFSSRSSGQRTTDLVLTLTPHIVRFPDIKEEDLAPVWVGTESRVSFFGSASPRVESGRSPEGPFDQPEDVVNEEPTEPEPSKPGVDMSSPVGGKPRPSPYGMRPRPQPGRDLVPSQGGSKGLEWGEQKDLPIEPGEPAAGEEEVEGGVGQAPAGTLAIGVEPSVVSVADGQERTLRLIAAGGAGAYRVPVGLSFDPDRLAVVSVEPASGVVLADQRVEAELGWLGLELVVVEASQTPRPLAAVTLRALAPGATSLILASDGAHDADGLALPVSVSDGAVFVLDATDDKGGQ